MVTLSAREEHENDFLSRELQRSEIRMKWVVRQLSDEQLREFGVTHFDRDAEDWAHLVIMDIDSKAMRAHLASERLQGMTEKALRWIWPKVLPKRHT